MNIDREKSMNRTVAIGATACVLLLLGAVGLTFFTKVSGAVIASGQLVVDSNVKKVQHPTGGVVGELLVRDGTRVKAGDTLVRLDDTQTKANLGIVTKQLDELYARQTREEAERDGLDEVVFPSAMQGRRSEPDIERLMAGESRLFTIRKNARDGQKAQMIEEISGIEMQRDSRVAQSELVQKELIGVNDLWKKNLVPYARVTTLEREAARLEGERGQLISQIAQTRQKIVQVDADMRAETGKDLGEIRGKISELLERKIAAEDQLKRVYIKAPQDGVVNQSSVHTVGGVVSPGEQLMLVVPENEALVVETRVQPQDIDQIWVGQRAVLKFTAFNQRTTPEINGTVDVRSADVTQDPKTGASYYTIRITVPSDEIGRLNGLKLMAGMPVEAFVQTGERTMASYLMRPLHDQLARAFAEK
jgi:HlyD family secretion protein